MRTIVWDRRSVQFDEKWIASFEEDGLSIDFFQEEASIAKAVQSEEDVFATKMFDIRPWMLSMAKSEPLSEIIQKGHGLLNRTKVV